MRGRPYALAMTRHNTERPHLELALEAAGLGEFEWDMRRDIIVVSERMSAIMGIPAGERPADDGRALLPHIHPDDVDRIRANQKRHLAGGGGAYEHEFRYIRPDTGATAWVRSAGILQFDDAGKPLRLCGIVQDITRHKVEEEQRRDLMTELDHRVKNVLAAVQALAIQTAKRTTSMDAFLQHFGGRLKAMGSANELLTAARWRGAAIDHLAAAELGALAPGQAHWDGPDIFLTPRAANALALGFHELTTNAVKFGALSVDAGQVNVHWNPLPDGGFELTWTESGGPTVGPPARRGFGSTLLEQVTGRELNGEAVVEYRPAGVMARLRAGAAAIAPRPDTMPEAPAVRPSEPAPASGGSDLNGARVLIVEDAVLLAMELELGLSDAGAQIVGPAYELSEALALLDQPLDAAVLDANLNGHSVLPVAQALFARNIPFVFATGYGESGGAPGGYDAPVIRKPYDVTQVAAAVAQLLAEAAKMTHP